MKVKSNLLIVLILTLPLFSFCQDPFQKPKLEYDFSLTMPGFTNIENYRAKLEFRKLTKNKKYRKVSLNLSSSYNNHSNFFLPKSDTVVNERFVNKNIDRIYAQIGLDKYIGKHKMILIGGGLLIGHELLYEYFQDDQYIWNSVDQNWNKDLLNSSSFFKGTHEVNYATIGIEANIGINVPLTSKWNIGVQASPRIVMGRSLKRTLSGDTSHEFNPQKTFVKKDYNLDVALRYSFGKKS